MSQPAVCYKHTDFFFKSRSPNEKWPRNGDVKVFAWILPEILGSTIPTQLDLVFFVRFRVLPRSNGRLDPPPPWIKPLAFWGGGKAGGTAGSPKPAAKFPFGVLVFSSNFKLVSGGFNFVLWYMWRGEGPTSQQPFFPAPLTSPHRRFSIRRQQQWILGLKHTKRAKN